MRRSRIVVGAILLALAGLQYLVTETLSALAFRPAYDYATNYISDLGVPDCGVVYAGRDICSPLAGVMNAGFIIDGTLFVLACLLLAPLAHGVLRYLILAAAVLHGVGNVLVGLFDETTPATLGTVTVHVVGATTAILFGNAVAILTGVQMLRRAARGAGLCALGVMAIVLGVVGIIALVVLGADGAGLPEGMVERFSVYPITAFELVVGAAILRHPPTKLE